MTEADADETTGPVRLLLADDHTMLRQSLRRTMEDEGLEVVGVASSGAEARHTGGVLTSPAISGPGST